MKSKVILPLLLLICLRTNAQLDIIAKKANKAAIEASMILTKVLIVEKTSSSVINVAEEYNGLVQDINMLKTNVQRSNLNASDASSFITMYTNLMKVGLSILEDFNVWMGQLVGVNAAMAIDDNTKPTDYLTLIDKIDARSEKNIEKIKGYRQQVQKLNQAVLSIHYGNQFSNNLSKLNLFGTR